MPQQHSFAVTDEQRMLAETLARFLGEANEFEVRRHRLAAASPDRLALWAGLADLGVIGALFAPEYGGFGGDARTLAVVMREIGIALAVEPLLHTAVIAGRVLRNWTDEKARLEMLESLIAGERICVLAYAPGDDPFAVPRLSATSAAEDVILGGNTACIRHAQVAHEFLVPAVLPDGSVSIYLVPAGARGLVVEAYRLMDASGAADLHFDSVRLPRSARLNLGAPTSEVLTDAIEWGILGLVAESVGIATALNDATFSYLMTRKQFGTALGNFQALQHRAADMHIALEEAIAMAGLAIESADAPLSPARSAVICAAKVVADGAGRRIGHEAIQLHGGMGVSDELRVSHYARRLAAIRAELGEADAHRLRFGDLR
jgi:alkylation response protein AidB-like acyl-CoA dehydrogenase